MARNLIEPKENDDISCHLQKIGMGTFICSAARQTGNNTTNEVNAKVCFNCDAGKIFRDIGCDAVLPKIRIFPYSGGNVDFYKESLFCKIRKRNTTLEYCKQCKLVTAETTKKIITTTRGIFESQGFFSAYKDIEKAREAIRDGNFENAATRSISCFESVMRTCHEKLNIPLPKKKQVSYLWKSTRSILDFDKMDPSGSSITLINSLAGVVTNLGGLRNTLSDAHGKSNFSPTASESIAELAINTASALSTFVIRAYIVKQGD